MGVEVGGDGGNQQRGISLSKCSKTKIRKMYVNSIAINFFLNERNETELHHAIWGGEEDIPI